MDHKTLLRKLELEDQLVTMLQSERVRKAIYRIVFEEAEKLKAKQGRVEVDPDVVMRAAGSVS